MSNHLFEGDGFTFPGARLGGAVNDYAAYVQQKLTRVPATGIAGHVSLPASLFPHQAALAGWALKRGRAAVFADTGLGKSRIQLAWADAVNRHTGQPVLILAPLAVAAQTVGEGAALGMGIRHCKEAADVGPGINITNYDRLHRFDAGKIEATGRTVPSLAGRAEREWQVAR